MSDEDRERGFAEDAIPPPMSEVDEALERCNEVAPKWPDEPCGDVAGHPGEHSYHPSVERIWQKFQDELAALRTQLADAQREASRLHECRDTWKTQAESLARQLQEERERAGRFEKFIRRSWAIGYCDLREAERLLSIAGDHPLRIPDDVLPPTPNPSTEQETDAATAAEQEKER